MTIQEAIKSGKPFRRKAWKQCWWMSFRKGKSNDLVDYVNKNTRWFSITDILATDWEVKP